MSQTLSFPLSFQDNAGVCVCVCLLCEKSDRVPFYYGILNYVAVMCVCNNQCVAMGGKGGGGIIRSNE